MTTASPPNGRKGNMLDSERFPPRMVLKAGKDGIITAVSLSVVFKPFPRAAQEYLSLAEHEALIAQARAEAKTEATVATLLACGRVNSAKHLQQQWDESKAARQRGDAGKGEK